MDQTIVDETFSFKDKAVKELCEIIPTDIEKIWNTATIPTISHQQVVSRLILYCKKYISVKKLGSVT